MYVRAGVTVYSPLKAHIHRPGAQVAVLGIGGLGHLAVQFAAKMGAQVGGHLSTLTVYPGRPCV